MSGVYKRTVHFYTTEQGLSLLDLVHGTYRGNVVHKEEAAILIRNDGAEAQLVLPLFEPAKHPNVVR